MKQARQSASLLGAALLAGAMVSLPAQAHNHQLAQHSGHDRQTGAPAAAAPQGSAVQEYRAAMDKMHDPMMKAIEHPDPDVAFVLGMIPHHQGAIDMAEIVLRHGKDVQNRKLAAEVIKAQKKEIAEMRAWLRQRNVPQP